MELRQLKHFLTLMRTLSFSRAAEEHGLTQQALSKSVQKMEEDLGVRLFERDTRKVEPTLFANLLLRTAGAVDAELRGFQQALDGLLGRGVDRLAVGVGPTGAGEMVGRAILETIKRRPRLRVDVHAGRYDTLQPALLRGDLDLMVVLVTEESQDPLLAKEVLAEERYGVVASARHPLAGRAGLSLAELLRWPWLAGMNLGAIDHRILSDFGAQGLTLPPPVFNTDSGLFTRLSLAETEMLAILPLGAFCWELDQGMLCCLDVPVTAAWTRPLAVFWRERSTRSADALALIATLRGAAAKRGTALT